MVLRHRARATIDLVVTGPQVTADPAELSAAYIVDQNLAQIVSVSFGNCESNSEARRWLSGTKCGSSRSAGMSVFVASGDAGALAAPRQPDYNNVGNVAAVNGVAPARTYLSRAPSSTRP